MDFGPTTRINHAGSLAGQPTPLASESSALPALTRTRRHGARVSATESESPGPRTGSRPSLLVLPCFYVMAQSRMRCFPVLRDVQELASFVPTALFAAGSGRCCPLLLRYLGPEPGGLRAVEVFLGPLGPARLANL